MTDIRQLQPTNVWQWFADICSIPHPTFHEHQLADFIINKVNTDGQKFGLTIEKDSVGNLLIQKPASCGMEQHAPVAIQAHYDMVAQKGTNSVHNFETDPIETMIKDGWVWANDTTLGADNGIGLAMALAVAFSDDIAHPPLRLIITSEEEVGMGGVQGLSSDWLQVPYLLNLDSEDSGELFIGCAGGRDITFSKTYQSQPLDLTKQPDLTKQTLDLTKQPDLTKQTLLTLKVSGLQGGHSGIDIHKGVANANLLLGRVLSVAYQTAPFGLVSLHGGTLRNVITREALALLVGNKQQLQTIVDQECEIIKNELQFSEENLSIELTETDIEIDVQSHQQTELTVLSTQDSKHVIDLLNAIPNGVIRMSDSFVGVVETSLSLGVLRLDQGELSVKSLMRSLGESQKDALAHKIQALADLADVSVAFSADYPGWLPDPNSYLLQLGQRIMQDYFGHAPKIQVIHAGLECGFLKAKAPNTDMISFGPNIRSAHSPKERVEIDSVAQNFAVLLEFLQALPKMA
ncbi:aminoacyl-histidine dipeptidase [Moraxella macacae 0408225]|uniref:Cytosol non-specific dipeptidase n=1 Tax=Moraxella macacae 0408225 TaxID=1230338 RepID=L2FAL4_9GAMM|nr:aminoacyl-histidine dipeptidase [Moraxella macacae]ELA09508.1 aminoacyl-histidine dipeptidase [Moraxella macacae 0408225]